MDLNKLIEKRDRWQRRANKAQAKANAAQQAINECTAPLPETERVRDAGESHRGSSGLFGPSGLFGLQLPRFWDNLRPDPLDADTLEDDEDEDEPT